MESDAVDETTKRRLTAAHKKLNPAKIARAINPIQQQLVQSAACRTQHQTASPLRTFSLSQGSTPIRTFDIEARRPESTVTHMA